MRIARWTTSEVVYHVICRFADGRWVIQDDIERAKYLEFLGRSFSVSDWRCLAYAVMSNHIHLSMVAGLMPLESWARSAHTSFAVWMNARQGRIGSVFAGRPKDYALLPEKEADAIAYIHNNPVRAKCVAVASESSWTSHRAIMGAEPAPAWLRVDEARLRCGFDDGAAFDAWVNGTPGDSGIVNLDEARRVLRRRGGLQLATPTAGALATIPIVGRPFAHVRIDPPRLIAVVAAVSGVGEDALCSRRRNSTLCSARRVVVHAGRAAGLAGSDIAAVLGISEQGVSKLARRPLTTDELRVVRCVQARLR